MNPVQHQKKNNPEISFSKINKAVAKRLREVYPDYKIYPRYPESNFDMPCFVIRTTGGNLRKKISQGKPIMGISFERYTVEFYSLDVTEIQKVNFEIRLLLDEVVTDDGEVYRCYNKNTMMALTENHVSYTFRIQTQPYLENEPLLRMTNLEMKEEYIHG